MPESKPLNWSRIASPQSDPKPDTTPPKAPDSPLDPDSPDEAARLATASMNRILQVAVTAESPLVTLVALRMACRAFTTTVEELLPKESADLVVKAAIGVSGTEMSPEQTEAMTSIVATLVTRQGQRNEPLSNEERNVYSTYMEKAGKVFERLMSDTDGPYEACIVANLTHEIAKRVLAQQCGEEALADLELSEYRATPHMLVFMAPPDEDEDETEEDPS
jgi:hypothetical protein